TPRPSYAMIEPDSTNLNIDTVLLACEKGPDGHFLQLQLYQTEEGLLGPSYAHSSPPKEDPRADVTIDGQRFAVGLVFAENYAVLGDDLDGSYPKLSDRLFKALQSGKVMKLRADVLAEKSGPSAFDGEAVVNLQKHGKAEAFRAMRSCAEDLR